jgi:alanine racemase
VNPSPRSLITVDLGAVRRNVAFLRTKLRSGIRFLAAVKADGYGHGMVECARAAMTAGADGVAVATAEEAVTLRDYGFSSRILVMGPLFDLDQYTEMAGRGIEFTIISEHMARMATGLAGTDTRALIHVKVDSGMNRQGLLPAQVSPFLEGLSDGSGVEVVGVMTHFPCAGEDPTSVDRQLERFLPCVRMVKAHWPRALAHAANSAATLYAPQAHLDMVRCGIAVYGLSPGQGDAVAEGLDPALSWTSHVALVKEVPAGEGVGYGHTYRAQNDTEVALVPLGYADGLFRLLGNRGHVLIRGIRYPIAGRISMDSFAVDLGKASGVRVDDKVTLLGVDGPLRVSAENMASWAETINYEVTCNISTARAQRRFVGDDLI